MLICEDIRMNVLMHVRDETKDIIHKMLRKCLQTNLTLYKDDLFVKCIKLSKVQNFMLNDHWYL
jgi:hypothetical protein